MAEYNKEIMQAVLDYLDSEDWHYDVEENGCLKMRIQAKSKFQYYSILCSVRTNGIMFLITVPMNATEDVRAKVMEFLTRVNYSLVLGGFDLDLEDGEIRYRAAIVTGDDVPTHQEIEDLLYISIFTLEKYADALIRVMFDLDTPEHAAESVD